MEQWISYKLMQYPLNPINHSGKVILNMLSALAKHIGHLPK